MTKPNRKEPNELRSPQHKIIVVDDEEDIVLALRGLFDSIDENIETLYSTDPLEVESIINENPDVEVIITDIRMPNLSGLDLMVRVRQEHPNIKFIVMTGFSSPELRTRSYGLGAVHYIEKPFDFEDLRKQVSKILTQKSESGFEGLVGSLHLAEVIQLLGISGRKTTLKVTSGSNEGVIALDGGNIIHARTVQHTGLEAFYEMFQWPGGKFTVGPYVRTQKTIDKPWQSLVIDAARVADEANVNLEPESEEGHEEIEFIEPLPEVKTKPPVPENRRPEPVARPETKYSALEELTSDADTSSEQQMESKRFPFAPPLSPETIQAKTASRSTVFPPAEPRPESQYTPSTMKSTVQKPKPTVEPPPPVPTTAPAPSRATVPPPVPSRTPLSAQTEVEPVAPKPVVTAPTMPPSPKAAPPPNGESPKADATDVLQDYKTTERIAELFVKMHDLAKASWTDKTDALPIDRIPMVKIPQRIASWVVLLMTEDVDGTLAKLTQSFDLHNEDSRALLIHLRNHLAKKRVVTKREWMELVRRAIAYEIGFVLEPLPTLTAFCSRLVNYQSGESAIDEIITRDQIDPEFRNIVAQTIRVGYTEATLKTNFERVIDGMPQQQRWELVLRQFSRLESFIKEMGLPQSEVPIECVMAILRALNEKNVAQGVEIVAYVGVNNLNLHQLESIREKYQNKQSGT